MKQFMFGLALVLGVTGTAAAQQPMMPGYGGMPSNGPVAGSPGGMPGYGGMPPGYGGMPAGYGGTPAQGYGPGQGVMPANYGPVANPYAAPVPGKQACGPNGCGPAGAGDKAEASRFGFNPLVRRLFHVKEDCGACNKCKTGAGAGAAQGGTLVFPNQPFIRSPRDFFME